MPKSTHNPIMLPSVEPHYSNGRRVKPNVYVLAVRHPKKPEKGVVARLLVERIEHVARYADGGISEVSFKIAYRVIGARPDDFFSRGNFLGGYSTFDNRVSITSTQVWNDGGVFMDIPYMKGHRIGTYMMNEVVTWAKQWPSASVKNVKLLESDAYPENKARRNWFYEQFGLRFTYDQPEKRSGISLDMLAEHLSPVDAWKKNITEELIFDCIGNAHRNLMEKVAEADALQSRLNRIERSYDNAVRAPFLWAIAKTYEKRGTVLVIGFVMLVASAAFFLTNKFTF
ncbi:hypothetical protein [Robbsia andropogonis]|uniref:hypothetical protein n=1 Tax=Robbsia andropogonis TaxID=28092 RepID=UPI00158CB1DD|nr:hypothetical protein [Robbsia andropogonis]